jgi:PAS domain S-box-containing protein
LLDLFAEQAARVIERKATERAIARRATEQAALFQLTDRMHRATSLAAVYDSALDAILRALDCPRAAILLHDDANVMRFVGWRGLSEGYRQAVEGHSPWRRDDQDPKPVCINDVEGAEIPERLKAIVKGEGIHALAFIPLMVSGRLLGKFMAYYDAPHEFTDEEMDLALTIGRQLGVGVEQKRGQEAAQRLAAIVESSDDAIITKNLDGIITSWNKGAQLLFGYTAEEMIGRPILTLIPQGRRDEEPGILEKIGRGQRIEHYETVRQCKDGTLRNISLTVSPVKDTQGKVIGASKIARDITERFRAREKLEQTVVERTAQLRDTVAELEAFSYSVAHDMRAPLRSMNSYSRFLEEDFGPVLPPKARDYVRRIAAGAGRLDALITDVLNYSKISRCEIVLQNVDVEKLTREIIDSYPDLRDSGGIILVQSPIPQVLGNPAALTQVLSNMLTNAVKFVAAGTVPHVGISAEKRGEHVRIWVEDNGIGISEEGQKRIFHMFQRLNPASEFEGTGIGLTIVRKAVERMGGQVGVESQPGRGSRFWFELKRAA